MDLLQGLGLAGAAFAAGGINAVAGGGSLVSFPALLAAGYPAKVANVTNAVALWPGYLGGSLGYRALLVPQKQTVVALSVSSILGALLGSAILLSTPASAFEAAVPFLILFGAALLALQPRVAAFVAPYRERRAARRNGPTATPPDVHASIFFLAVYGAYFGAGLGILTLAVLGIVLPDDLQRSNALKGVLSLVINAVAVVIFGIFGPVEWLPALIMAVAALAGGYFGVRVARRLSARVLRWSVVVFSAIVAGVLFIQ